MLHELQKNRPCNFVSFCLEFSLPMRSVDVAFVPRIPWLEPNSVLLEPHTHNDRCKCPPGVGHDFSRQRNETIDVTGQNRPLRLHGAQSIDKAERYFDIVEAEWLPVVQMACFRSPISFKLGSIS
jgi:hypothetical protein